MLGLNSLSQCPISSAVEDAPTVAERRVRRCTTRSNWAAGMPSRSATGGCWNVSRQVNAVGAGAWWMGGFRGVTARHPWSVSMNRNAGPVSPWAHSFGRRFQAASAVWVTAIGADAARAISWAVRARFSGRPYYIGTWLLAAAADTGFALSWTRGVGGSNLTSSAWARADAVGAMRWAPWVRYSRALSPGWGVVTPPNPGGDREPLFEIFPQRVYIVLNQVVLQRVADGAEIPVESLSLSLDASSWAWGFEASIPGWAQALVSPSWAAPVELLARINGAEIRLLAESIARERAFASSTLRVSGRGHHAVLAAPYAPVMNFTNAQARTARQLMDDVLTINGVPLGWTVDWALADWNVPAGAFSHQGTWIDALVAIAGAAGGYLLPHPTAQTIRVRHRYPVAPWEWGTVVPDVSLPVDAVSLESMRWVSKPGYNRVYVAGEVDGIRGKVTRGGSAGNVLAPMVVDQLVTDAPAARQRGIAVLADTGRQTETSLRVPVFAQMGIIEPGTFVEYQDGSVSRLGIVRGTKVQAAFPEVWQTLEVQAYE